MTDAPLADPDVRRVALVRLRVGLGDLLCSAPALRALRSSRPDVSVTMITWAETAAVVGRTGYVDELLPFPGVDGIPERPARRDAWEPFLAAARQRHFDLAVQCYGDNPVANRVTAALGARHVGGFAPAGWVPPPGSAGLHLRYPTGEHEVWRHLRLVELLGVPLPDRPDRMEFPLSDADDAELDRLLRRHGLAPGSYAVLHPGASAPSRRWPPDRFAAVGDALHAGGLAVVLTGTADEREVTGAVARAMRAPVTDLAGTTTLGGLAALLRDAAVVVSNDTGCAHLAAAVGAASVTIFQPGDPRRWAHTGRRHRALVPDVPCAPCRHLVCPIGFPCSRATGPAAVLARVRDVLAA